MKLRVVFLAALLGLAIPAFADNPVPAAGGNPPPKGGMCAQNPSECQQLASKFDQWCSANADKCTNVKARMEKHREWCENNKEKCQQMMQKMRGAHGGQNGGDSDDDDTSSPPA